MSALDTVTAALQQRGHTVKNHATTCPAHDDSTPSLSVTERDGKVLLNCHTGCSTEEVVAALGLTVRDLFDGDDRRTATDRRRIVATYDYTDADGNLLFQVVRYEPKDFRQRRPDGRGGWIWRDVFSEGTRPTLYQLPDVIRAVADDELVFICEGEKDADALARAGEVATCGPMGAGKWDRVAGIAQQVLTGAGVVVVPDRDAPGYSHALDIVRSLDGIADLLTAVEPVVGKDVSDHLAQGHAVDDLVAIDVAELERLAAPTNDTAEDEQPPSWIRPGGQWLFEEYVEKPAIWGRDDEILWPEDESLVIAAPTGVGKTTLAVLLVRSMVGLGGDVLGYPVTECGKVLYLAMDRPSQIRRAMRRLFTPDETGVLNDRLIVRPAPLPADLGKNPEVLIEMAMREGADRIVLDSVKDAISKVADDESGGNFNRAIQMCNAESRPIAALHHQRKGQQGARPNRLEDVFGSTWITAGAGSVVLLWGEAGSGTAELIHLKTPSTPVGPLAVEINTFTGDMTVARGWDPLAWLTSRGESGGLVPDAARAMTGKEPTKTSRDRARRKLEGLVNRNMAKKSGGGDPNSPATYFVMGSIEALP